MALNSFSISLILLNMRNFFLVWKEKESLLLSLLVVLLLLLLLQLLLLVVFLAVRLQPQPPFH